MLSELVEDSATSLLPLVVEGDSSPKLPAPRRAEVLADLHPRSFELVLAHSKKQKLKAERLLLAQAMMVSPRAGQLDTGMRSLALA